MKRVSKVFIRTDNTYVFVRKREPESKKKDDKLELIGGTLEPGETPFHGLIRELSEEELSGLLADKTAKLQPDPICLDISGEPHYIYEITLTKEDVRAMRPCPVESYGFTEVDSEFWKSVDLKNNRIFTPKTLKIFKALGCRSSSD